MSDIRSHTSADSDPGPNVDPEVSALFDEFTVRFRLERNISTEARQVDHLLDMTKFQKLVAKGAKLHELMVAEPTESAQSRFTDVHNLHKWGYIRYDSNDPVQLQQIDDTLAIIGVGASPAERYSPNIPVSHTHDRPVAVGGTLFPATNALLCQVINPSSGVMVAYDNITAQFATKTSGCTGTRVPHLNHWSDIAYLQWLSKAGTDSILRFILRYNVLNDLTCFAVNFMSSHSGLGLTEWPGTSFSAGSEEFNAMLGSPNGHGVAHLLIQHKKQLGHKAVEKVTIFSTKHETMLLFQIGDVDDSRTGVEPEKVVETTD